MKIMKLKSVDLSKRWLTVMLIGFLSVLSVAIANPKRISIQEVKALIDKKTDAVIVDVRGYRSYQQKHLPTSISIPVGELENRHQELPKNKLIIFYCS
ncbi:MAG: rhodanese-like domain-containing protein [Candidatus Poribacteria bacterium]|jgi:hypothetical protein|nr:rhodanese-like domain-containing protein [Candidatus Poribacteria bacterium]MDP6747309.1 rhodanese-like domain-containing protein [Candidatus Poribacteria bacterium]MDP6997330.1 rhodanese-like domain-containing protein [Candidatus Poribacteria bacterium]